MLDNEWLLARGFIEVSPKYSRGEYRYHYGKGIRLEVFIDDFQTIYPITILIRDDGLNSSYLYGQKTQDLLTHERINFVIRQLEAK